MSGDARRKSEQTKITRSDWKNGRPVGQKVSDMIRMSDLVRVYGLRGKCEWYRGPDWCWIPKKLFELFIRNRHSL